MLESPQEQRPDKGNTIMRANDFLPDTINESTVKGVLVRKGTVGAFLVNAKILRDATASAEAQAQAQRDVIEALPAMRALGLFDVLEIRDEKLRAFVAAH